MQRRLRSVSASIIVILILTSWGISFNSTAPPQGYTGFTGSYCNNCHSGNVLNDLGGSVTVSNLPVGIYTRGATYNFSITITHASPDRTRWGFSIVARNSLGMPVGTFSSTNPNAEPNGNELSHKNAVFTGAQSSYTYSNLRWTAPAAPAAEDMNISFYFVGNAANGNGNTLGDFIYSGTTGTIILPIILSSFHARNLNNTAHLEWTTDMEANTSHFIIERSTDGNHFREIDTVNAAGNSSTKKNYQFTDDKLQNEKSNFFFYRIVTKDNDGKRSYSEIQKISTTGSKNFIISIFPIPAVYNKKLQVSIQSKINTKGSSNIIGADGKTLLTQSFILIRGSNTLEIDLASLNGNEGYLVAQFNIDGERITVPWILIR